MILEDQFVGGGRIELRIWSEINARMADAVGGILSDLGFSDSGVVSAPNKKNGDREESMRSRKRRREKAWGSGGGAERKLIEGEVDRGPEEERASSSGESRNRWKAGGCAGGNRPSE